MFAENLALLWVEDDYLTEARSALPHAPQRALPTPVPGRTRTHLADLLDSTAELLHAAAARMAPATAPAKDLCSS